MNELILVGTYDEDSYKNEMYEYVVDGKTVGSASVMAGETAYVERIDIEEEYRNHGYGTAFLRELSDTYGFVYLAPDNADAQRLYERIGREYTGEDADYVDQGFGVYEI